MTLLTRPAVGPSATALARSPLAPAELMPLVADLPLPVMFVRWGPFPAVLRVDGQQGSWDVPGRSRTLRLSDGGAAVETLVEVVPGHAFAYEVTRFTDVFRHLVRGTRGTWTFSPDGDGTMVHWTWEFAARPGRRRLVSVLIAPLWQRYMRRILPPSVASLTG